MYPIFIDLSRYAVPRPCSPAAASKNRPRSDNLSVAARESSDNQSDTLFYPQNLPCRPMLCRSTHVSRSEKPGSVDLIDSRTARGRWADGDGVAGRISRRLAVSDRICTWVSSQAGCFPIWLKSVFSQPPRLPWDSGDWDFDNPPTTPFQVSK